MMRRMAHLVLIGVYVAAAVAALIGIWLTVQLFLWNDNDRKTAAVAPSPW